MVGTTPFNFGTLGNRTLLGEYRACTYAATRLTSAGTGKRYTCTFYPEFRSQIVSTLTRSYSYGNVYKNCRSSFPLKPNSGPETTHPLTQYALRRVFSLYFPFFSLSFLQQVRNCSRQFIFLQLLNLRTVDGGSI